MNRTTEMCKSRRCRALMGTEKGWWYVNPRSIDVLAYDNTTTTQVRLTRKQLDKAIEIMDSAQDRREP